MVWSPRPGKGTAAPVASSSAYRFRGPRLSSLPPAPRLPFFLVIALLPTASFPPHINPIPLRLLSLVVTPPRPRRPHRRRRDTAAAAARWRPPWRRSRATSPSAPAPSRGAPPGWSRPLSSPLALLFGATVRRLAVISWAGESRECVGWNREVGSIGRGIARIRRRFALENRVSGQSVA